MTAAAARGPAPAGVIDGLVLAGGMSSRMGGPATDKAWLPLAGEPLIVHVARSMRADVATLYVSTNGDAQAYRAIGLPLADAPDPHTGSLAWDGPLAGVLAGLCATRAQWLAVAPCDSPFLPRGWIGRLYDAAQRAGAPLAVATCAGLRQPVCMLVRTDLRASLQATLAAGQRKVGGWQRQAGAVEVAFDDAAAHAFMNINTPADLDSAQALVARLGTGGARQASQRDSS